MNLGKKIIALSLVAVMSLQTVNATVLDRALSNYTPPQIASITDSEGNNIKTMLYTGSFYYRFSESATPQLLWTVSPPEIEVGCNGFNLKGMFMSLLGIDQFGSMLQNAGTSLAWGVAIGLIYSLPGVASVFKFINQWAKDIQKLLGNACQSGIAIGQAIAANSFGPSVNEFTDKVDNTLSSWTLAGSKQEGTDGIASKLGLSDYGLKWDNGLSFTGKDTVPDAIKKDAFAQSIARMFRSHSIGATILLKQIERKSQIATKINTAIQAGSLKEAAMVSVVFPLLYDGVSPTSGDVKPEFTNITVDFLAKNAGNPDDQNTFGLKMLAYAFLYNFVGDMGYGKGSLNSAVEKINNAYNCSGIVGGTDKNKCEAEKSNYTKILRDFIENGAGNLKPKKVGGSAVSDPNRFYTAIVKGFEEAQLADKKLYAPMMYAVANKNEGSGSDYSYLLFPIDKHDDHLFFGHSDPFPGLEAISKCSLFKMLVSQGIDEGKIQHIKSVKGSNGTTNTLECDSMVDTISTGSDGNPTVTKTAKYPVLFYGDLTEAAAILSKLKPSEQVDLIEVLEKNNTYILVKSVVGQLNEILSSVSVDSNERVMATAGASATDQKLAKNIESLTDYQQVGMKEIHDQWETLFSKFDQKLKIELGTDANPLKLREELDKGLRKIQERALKNSPNY